MILQNRRLMGGVTVAVLAAAAGGFTVARCTSETAGHSIEAPAKSETNAAEAAPTDRLAMTAAAITAAGIITETIKPGGLDAEIVAQATVVPSAMGQAIVTARASGAVTRVFKRLGDPRAA